MTAVSSGAVVHQPLGSANQLRKIPVLFFFSNGDDLGRITPK
jgi:hypothetical protein